MKASYFNKRVLMNASAAFVDSVVGRAAQAAVFYVMGRYYGPRTFGAVTLAFALSYIGSTVATFGSLSYGIKTVAAGEARGPRFLSALLGFRLLNAALVFALLALFVLLSRADGIEAWIVLLLAACLFPNALSCISDQSIYDLYSRLHPEYDHKQPL